MLHNPYDLSFCHFENSQKGDNNLALGRLFFEDLFKSHRTAPFQEIRDFRNPALNGYGIHGDIQEMFCGCPLDYFLKGVDEFKEAYLNEIVGFFIRGFRRAIRG